MLIRLGLIILLTLSVLAPRLAPSVDPPSVDPLRMQHTIETLTAFGPRVAATESESYAAAWIAAQFVDLGLAADIQSFPFTPSAFYRAIYPDQPHRASSLNVVATIPGTDPRRGTLYLGAHYDSVPRSPGANDNASGVAVLVEIARLLQADPLPITVVLIAFGSEEFGLLGSRAFAAGLSWDDRLRAQAMLALDCVGQGSTVVVGADRDISLPLQRRVAATATMLGYPATTTWTDRSDHAAFSERSIPAILIATQTPGEPICGNQYHQPTDTAATIDPAALDRSARTTLEVMEDLAATVPDRNPSRTWLPEIAYP